ncbi:MAG: hypothetical protein HQ494_15615 [Rhodospirillales bacterium]|nr:hypothetical protein [Rhodospirillales bacterium]
MTLPQQSFLGISFLRSVWGSEFVEFKDSKTEKDLIDRLEKWRDREVLKETSSEEAFQNVFFRETWGYESAGVGKAEEGFSMYPQFSVEGAGQGGKTGKADLALGWFKRTDVPETPQVLCEFKDIFSDLDAPQKRKGNTRSAYYNYADRGDADKTLGIPLPALSG